MSVTELRELQRKSKLPANQAGGSTVKAFFEANKNNLAAVMPKHMTADRMVRIALGALRANPKLLECTTESLVGGVMQCAQLGLEPNTPLGHAYLIPFKNNRAKPPRTDVQVIFGYRGLIDLARRSGQIVSLAAHTVHENDEFDFAYGLEDFITHKPAIDQDRGEMICAYAVAKLQDGGHQFEVMSKADLDRVMYSTQSGGKYGPWKDHYPEMCRKTVIRRLFKYLPVSIELATAASMDEVASAGGDQHLDTVLEGNYTIMPDDYEPAGEEAYVSDTEVDQGAAEPQAGTVEIDGKTYPELFTDPETNESNWVDADGVFFDSNQHGFSEKNQIPLVSKDGTFRPKRSLK